METIGKTIAYLRKKNSMTQSELAEKMNVTDKAVSKWERDLSYPDVKTISKLADVLNVSVEELLKNKKQDYTKGKLKNSVNLILKAVALAMGTAAIVLNLLNQADAKTSAVMLGIGLFCVGIYLFNNKDN